METLACFNCCPPHPFLATFNSEAKAGFLPGQSRTSRFGCGVTWNRPVRVLRINKSGQFAAAACVCDAVQPSVEGEGKRSVCGGEEGVGQKGFGVQRYLMAVEYIGTRFSGSQWQPRHRTVVGVLQDAFQQFIGQPVSVVCSSRTDAGVHALSNIFHVDVVRISKRRPDVVLPPHDPRVVRKAVNHFLKKNEGDISLVDVRSVPANFHARFSGQERTYFYRLLSGPDTLSLFERERAWHVSEDLDILSMQKSCKILVGQHDFSSFRAARCQAKSPVKTLNELHIVEEFPYLNFPSRHGELCADDNTEITPPLKCVTDGTHGDVANSDSIDDQIFGQRRGHRSFVITARARSFLYHQVRLLVGVLKSVGTGELSVGDVQRILDAKIVTTRPMAPACDRKMTDFTRVKVDPFKGDEAWLITCRPSLQLPCSIFHKYVELVATIPKLATYGFIL